MPNAVSDVDTDSPDWQSPGLLAQNTPISPRVTPASGLRQEAPPEGLDDYLSQKAEPLKVQTEEKPISDEDVTSYLSQPAPSNKSTGLEGPSSSDVDAYLRSPLPNGDLVRDFGNPDSFSRQGSGIPSPMNAPKRVVAEPLPVAQETMPGRLGGTENALYAEGRNIEGSIGSGIQWAGSLLSQMDNTVDQTDDRTNPYIQAGLQLRSAANQEYPQDPNRPTSSMVGNIAGSVLPVAVTGGSAAVPEASAGLLGLTAKAIGSGMFGGQMYAEAQDKGVSPGLANVAGATGLALGGALPSTNLFHASPAIASATWGQLAKNTAWGTLLNSSKTYWEMAGINQVSGEASNAVLPADQQQTQSQIAYNSLAQALPMAFVGALSHGIGQINAETSVAKVAAGEGDKSADLSDLNKFLSSQYKPAQDKASFIVNTAQSINSIASDSSKNPQQKMQAVTDFMKSFSPQAQGVIAAHVQNVDSTIKSIQDAVAAQENLAPTNPQTAVALGQEAKDTAIAKMQQTAIQIEADAKEESLPPELAPEPEKTEEPAARSVPEPATPQAEPPQVEGAMPAKDYSETQAKLASSPDTDISARAEQLSEERQAIIEEHQATDSDAKKSELESDLLNNEASMRDLAEEPPAPKPEAKTEPVKSKEITDYDEYGQPVYALEPHVETQAQAEPAAATVPEGTPADNQAVESRPTEQGSAAPTEGTAPVAGSGETKGIAPAQHIGDQEQSGGKPPIPLYNLKEDIDGHPKGSTVSGDTLKKLGYELPEKKSEEPAPGPVSLDGLSRKQMELVAANEGHSPDDIKEAKGKDLKDLIEAKRVSDSDASTELKQDGDAYVDPKIDQLPPKYQKAVKTFMDAAKEFGLQGISKFVLMRDPDNGGSSIFTFPRRGVFYSVYIDPLNLARDLSYVRSEGATKASIEDYFQRVFSEESIHNQAGIILSKEWASKGKPGTYQEYYDKRFSAIYDEMTKKQRDATAKSYGGDLKGVDTSKRSSQHDDNRDASRMGEEFFRQVIQRRSGKGITEDAIARIKKNKPLRTLIQSIANRFKGIAAKLETAGKPDSQIASMINDLEKLSSADKKNEPPERFNPLEPASPSAKLTPDENEGKEENASDSRNSENGPRIVQAANEGSPGAVADLLRGGEGQGAKVSSQQGNGIESPSRNNAEYNPWLDGDEGVDTRTPYVPTKTDEEAAALKPFVEQGEGGELKPTGDERLESERVVPENAQRKEGSIASQIESLKHIEIPADDQVRIKSLAETQARLQFSNEANRDVAEGNAFVKAMIEAKKWQEKNGSLAGFGARRIIQNSLLDDARKMSRGESISNVEEEPEMPTASTEEGEPEAKPKGYDASNQDYEAQQSQFEPTGNEPNIPSHLETPAKKAQDAIVNRNIKDVTGMFSPYGKRLLELWSDTPHQEGSAFPAWVSAAAKEFGISRAKVMADKDEIDNRVRQEVNARGLTPEDFTRISASPKLRPETGEREHGLTSQVANDNRLGDDVRALMADKYYQMKSNQASNQEANDFIAQHGEDASYGLALNKILTGKPTSVDAAVFQKINQKLLASADPNQRLRGIQDGTMVAMELTKAGQFTQAFRMWSKLGGDGALLAYDKIIRPVIDGAQLPYKDLLDQIKRLISSGKLDALKDLLDRFEKNGVFAKAEKMSNQKMEEEKPVWQRYMESTAEALSKMTDAKDPVVKGTLQEFADRMKATLKSLADENLPDNKEKPKPPQLSAEGKLSEIYKNEEAYREAWNYAKLHIEAKFADNPKVLELFRDTLDKAFQAPIKLHDEAVASEVKSRGFSFRQIAKNFADATSLRDNVANDIAGRTTVSPEQAEALKADLASSFDKQLAKARDENAAAQDRAEKVKKASFDSIKQGIPIWQRYTDQISKQVSKLVDATKDPATKVAMQEFSGRVAANLKSLVNEATGDKAVHNPKLTSEQRLGEIYRNFPEYQQAWDAARNEMRTKIGDDPEKLKKFNSALSKALDAPISLQDKVLNNAVKASGVSMSRLVKEWSGTQNATRDALIKSITDSMGLNPEMSQKLGDAIYSRFQERLQAAKKAEVAKILKQSGTNRIVNDAPSLAEKIFKAVNLGLPDDHAVWNALADKLKLPKYNQAIADDLRNRANEIQKMIADSPGGKGSKITDDKTQDMMNILADEAQKHTSYLKQFGQGEMAVFYGNIFGPSTVGRKSISEVMNLFSEVGTMAAGEMRHGDALAIPRAYAAAFRGLYQRGGADFRSIMTTGRGMRQASGDYTSNNLVERGKIFGNIPVLSKLNKPLSAIYKPVGRTLYGAQAFFYAGSAEARANMIAYRTAKQLIAEGKNPDELTVGEMTQQILGNSPEMRQAYAKQASEEGLTGNAAILRAQELAEQQRPEPLMQAAHDFASRATFMQEPEGVLGVLYRGVSQMTRQLPVLRLLIPVTRVVSNVFNNFLSYTPAGAVGAIRYAKEGKSDEMYQQIAKVTAGALGTIAMATFFGPNIQGSGPADYGHRKQLMDQGWIPFSVKVGDKYVSYREWPVALMMAGLGSYYDQSKYNEGGQKDLPTRLAMAMAATGRFGLTSSWISSVSNVLDAFNSQNYESFEKSMFNIAGTTTGGLVPFNQSTLKVIDKIFDPEMFPAKDLQGALMSQVAFVRRENNPNQPALNALGDPIQSNPIQAFYSSTTVDPVWSGLGDKGVFIPTASKSEKINNRPITNDEYYNLVRNAGQSTKAQLQNTGLDAMAGMDQEQAQEFLNKIYHANLKQAKAEIESDAPDAGQGKPTRRRER